MQWTDGPNGGFSTAPASRLVRPMVSGKLGPSRVNVAAQRRDPNSLLNWIERLIRRRKETPEFGWGTSSLIETAAPAIFAHRCDWQGSTVAAVHNLSGSRTDATLDLGLEKGEKIEIEDLLEKRDHKPRRTEASTWSSRATATCGCAWSVRPETAERSAPTCWRRLA